jgi:hypothetical protein
MGSRDKKDTVATKSEQFAAMEKTWALPFDLIAGTQRMRSRGTTWLPQEVREDPKQYSVRIGRSFLYNATKDTRDKWVSKPFSKPITLRGVETLDDRLKDILPDADLSGRSLDALASDLFSNAIETGKCHLLVDFPSVPEGLSLADEERLELRPTFVQIRSEDLFAWRAERMPNGEPELTQIRWYEDTVEAEGQWGDQVVRRIRVMTTDTWEIWEKERDRHDNPTDKYVMVEEGTHTFGSIPLVTGYIIRTGFMTSESALGDISWLNLAHWQSMSDQRNILRFARVGMIFAAGLTKKELEGGLTIGPNEMVGSSNENAKMEVVEHNGKSIAAGRQDLLDLEQKMEVLGVQPLVNRANPTVIGQAIGEAKSITVIQSWVRIMETLLEEAYELAATWVKTTLPEDFGVDIFNDFGISLDDTREVEALLKARVTGEITQETLLNELKRRGVLSDSVDVEQEIEQTTEEDARGLMGLEGDEE